MISRSLSAKRPKCAAGLTYNYDKEKCVEFTLANKRKL